MQEVGHRQSGRHKGFAWPVKASAPPAASFHKASFHQQNPILLMQQTAGNQAVRRLLAAGLSQAIPATLRRTAGMSAQAEEQEQFTGQPVAGPASATLQRKCNSCEQEEKLQRKCSDCEEERKVHRKEGGLGPDTAPRSVHQVLNSPGRPLDQTARVFMESRFGHDFSGVRVHTDALAAESAREVNALAYTVGRNVVFGAGQYAPHTEAGRRLLAHELAHTVQNPGTRAVFPFLKIGRADDPAERAADDAADAVMRGHPVPSSPAGSNVLRRQQRCTADTTERADQRIVHCGTTDYRVTMTTSRTRPRPETRTTVSAGWNNSDIFMNIDVCRGGTAVRVRPTVDLPRAARQAIGNVLAGSPVLAGAQLSPGFDITLEQSDSYTISLTPRVTVDPRGVSGGGVGVEVQTRDVTVGGQVTYDARTRAGFLNIEISGGRPTRHVDCHHAGDSYLVFQCERITHVPGVPEVPERRVPEDEIRYIFFQYPTANIRRDFRLPTDIQSLYDQGYRVASIDGYTSPEGPRSQETPAFEGNIRLGQERADAALTWLREVCPACDFSGVRPQGHGELPPGQAQVEPEPRGPRMEREAVEEFLGTGPGQTPDPLAPHTQEEIAAFRRLPRAQQRERAFELMRRAVIRFHRDRLVQEHRPAVAPRDEYHGADCPQEVIDAARASFGINIMTGVLPQQSR